MAFLKAEYSGSQTNTTLVAAVSNRIILVTRVVFTTDSDTMIKLVSDPGGTPADITPVLYTAANVQNDLNLGHAFALGTGLGKALGITTTPGVPGEHSVLVWYELVT